MQLDDYQSRSAKTLIEGDDKVLVLARMALGLSGESGEVAEKIKKVLRDSNGEMSELVKKELSHELGDVLWYLARLADITGSSLSQIAEDNLAKLESRQKRGKLGGSGDNR